MRLIPIESVREKSVLAKSIFDNNGIVMLRKGAILNNQVIDKVKKLNILSIYIEDEYSDIEIDDIIKPELRQKAINYLKEAFNNMTTMFYQKPEGNTLQEVLVEKKNKEYFSSIKNIAEELVESILCNKKVLVGLVDIKSLNNYIYQHSINVAVISLVIGISARLRKDELLDLALGALVHDIGKTFISKDIINKKQSLDDEEMEKFKLHPELGYEYVKQHLGLNTKSKMIVAQHHERIDGLGYPNGIKGGKISYFARIVAIADAYDYLTSDTVHTRAIPASDALEFIMAHVNILFDYELVYLFSKVLIAYPTGTVVRLSNGDIATVVSTQPNYPLRPKVRIIKSNEKNKIGETISLVNQLSVVISNVEFNV